MIMLPSLEQRLGWRSLDRTAGFRTESTNMMFFTSVLRQSQDVLVITMASNQSRAWHGAPEAHWSVMML